MNLLNRLLSFPKCELFINLMYRFIDMAIRNASQADNMDTLFGCRDWRDFININDPANRAKSIIHLFSSKLNAKYVIHMYMRGFNNGLKYILLHASNHVTGWERMKDSMWKVDISGNFTAYERNDPNQLILISAEPDLNAFKDKLWNEFVGQSVRIHDIYNWMINKRILYRKEHLHQILRDCRKNRFLNFFYTGKFSFKQNPIVQFPVLRPEGV